MAAAQECLMTVVLPIFNEANSIAAKLPPFFTFVREHPEFEFRFVDDGSSDQTANVLEDCLCAAGLPNLSVLRLSKNVGKGNAIRAGFEAGCAQLFCFTDGDMAYDPVHILRLYDALQHHDVAIGCRHLAPHITRNTVRRKVLGWGFNKLARMILGLPFVDTQSGLKGLRRDAAALIFKKQLLGGFAFDVEMLFLARKKGFTISEVAAEVAEDHAYKKSKVKLLKDSVHMLREMLAIRLHDLLGKYD